MSLFEELKRRNVFRVGIAYCVAAWLLLQVTDIVAPILDLPDSIPRTVLFLLVIGFIPALILAWAFELTPEGVKLESEVDRSKSITSQTGRKLDRAIIVVLVIAIGFLLFDKFALEKPGDYVVPADTGAQSGTIETQAAAESGHATAMPRATPIPAQKSVAVLPFVAMSNGPNDDYFSDGLTEEIINALAQLPELLITARTSAFHFKGRNEPIDEIAGQLGVDHIVEGSVRRAGEQLRITAQLVRAQDGFHLWSETYDRRTEDTFAVQEDIAEKVATALNIVLDDDQRKRMRQVGIGSVEAYTGYQKGIEAHAKAHGEGIQISLLRQGNRHFEDAIALAPDFSDAYLNHSDLYSHILMIQANGELDGNISKEDIHNAPLALEQDYNQAIRHARNVSQRLVAEFDRALLLGEWRSLASLSNRALTAPGCEVALWAYLAGTAFGRAQLTRDAFERRTVCDPVLTRGWIHLVYADLWLGQPQRAIQVAESRLLQSHWLASAYITALTMTGKTDEAAQAINSLLSTEEERLIAQTTLAAMIGDGAEAKNLQDRFLEKHGPNDFISLILEAQQGNRNEANRLAGLIDFRSFGYMPLMQAIYYCVCGAPFDLEATPVFASMLSDSGLPWPPLKPIDFPMKEW